MSGIAQGLTNIANIAIGTTPIVKVSLGDTLIWPSTPVNQFCFLYTQSFNSADSATLALPFEAVVGQLCVCYNRTYGVAPASVAVPAGFTMISSSININAVTVVSYKILTQQDITNNSVTGISNDQTQMILVTYAGSLTDIVPNFIPITSVEIEYALINSSNNVPTIPSFNSVTAGVNSQDCVITAVYGSNGVVAAQGWSGMTFENLFSTDSDLLYVKGHILKTTDTTLTVSIADYGVGNVLGLFVLRATV